MQNDSLKSLKDITSKIGSGATPRGGNNNYKSSGISLIRSQNIHDFKFSYDGLAFIDETQAKELNNVEVLENDILLNITGDSIARVCMVPNEVLPARVNQHVSIVRCKDKEDAEYVLCYLQFLKKHLLSICKVGGTRNALTKDAVEKIRIKIRPNHKLLGKYIKQINAKMELNNNINRELEAMAKTLYDYWFVQFDFPNEQGKPYKSSDGKMVYNAELKREIPEGWEVVSLECLVQVVSEKVSPQNIDSKTAYIGLEHIPRKTIVLSEWETAEKVDSDKSAFRKHDIFFGKIRPYFHKVGVAFVDGITSTDTIVLRPKKKEFLGFALETVFTDSFVEVATLSSTGTKMPRANWEILKNYKIPSPPLKLLCKYQLTVDNIIAKIETSVYQNQTLKALRDWLLPMLMNGQVTVKEAEEKLSMAAEPSVSYESIKSDKI